MFTILLISLALGAFEFRQLENALAAGKYYSISYSAASTSNAQGWTATEMTDQKVIVPSAVLPCKADDKLCPTLTASPWSDPKVALTSKTCTYATGVGEAAAAFVVDQYFRTATTALAVARDAPSITHIADCDTTYLGTDPDSATAIAAPAKCATTANTHVLSALQAIVEHGIVTETCIAESTSPLTGTCAVACTESTKSFDTLIPKAMKVKIGAFTAAKDNFYAAAQKHLQTYGAFVAQASLGDIKNLEKADGTTSNAALADGEGILCKVALQSAATANPDVKVWVEVVGYAQITPTKDDAICGKGTTTDRINVLVCRTPASEVDFLIAASNGPAGYFYAVVSNAAEAGTDVSTLKLFVDDTQVGYFVYHIPAVNFPTTTTKPLNVTIDATSKKLALPEFKEAEAHPFMKYEDTIKSYSTFSADLAPLIKQLNQQHFVDQTGTETAQLMMEALLFTHLRNATAKDESVISVAGTLESMLPYNDEVYVAFDNTKAGETLPNAIAAVPYTLMQSGIVFTNCIADKKEFATKATRVCTVEAANAPATWLTLGAGYHMQFEKTVTEANLKKYLVQYGPVVATFKLNDVEFTTHYSNTTRTATDVYKQAGLIATNAECTVLLLGFGTATSASNVDTPYWNAKALIAGKETITNPIVNIAIESTNAVTNAAVTAYFYTTTPFSKVDPGAAFTASFSSLFAVILSALLVLLF